jgi:hypothetical protein
MGEVASRFLQTIRFERDAYVWMDFNDRATGDGAILVAITQVLMFAGIWGGRRSLFQPSLWQVLIQFVFGGLILWLVYTGITYAIVRFLIQGHAEFATYLRFSGFAFPTRLLAIAAVHLLNNISVLAMAIGSVWFVAIMARGIEYHSDLGPDRSWPTAVGGLIGAIIVNSILGWSLVL